MNQLCFELIGEMMVRGSAESNELKIAKGQFAFLTALLASQDHVATLDDATKDLNEKFEDLGKWRGRITLELKQGGIIEPIGATNSNRPSRNRGLLRVWTLCDVARAKAWLKWLERRIEGKENPPAAATADGISESKSQDSNQEEPKNATE